MLIDVSEGGLALMLMSREDLRPHMPVQVTFRLGERAAEPVCVEATVVGTERSVLGMHAVWHLRTRSLDIGTRVALREYVSMSRRVAA